MLVINARFFSKCFNKPSVVEAAVVVPFASAAVVVVPSSAAVVVVTSASAAVVVAAVK